MGRAVLCRLVGRLGFVVVASSACRGTVCETRTVLYTDWVQQQPVSARPMTYVLCYPRGR